MRSSLRNPSIGSAVLFITVVAASLLLAPAALIAQNDDDSGGDERQLRARLLRLYRLKSEKLSTEELAKEIDELEKSGLAEEEDKANAALEAATASAKKEFDQIASDYPGTSAAYLARYFSTMLSRRSFMTSPFSPTGPPFGLPARP